MQYAAVPTPPTTKLTTPTTTAAVPISGARAIEIIVAPALVKNNPQKPRLTPPTEYPPTYTPKHTVSFLFFSFSIISYSPLYSNLCYAYCN